MVYNHSMRTKSINLNKGMVMVETLLIVIIIVVIILLLSQRYYGGVYTVHTSTTTNSSQQYVPQSPSYTPPKVVWPNTPKTNDAPVITLYGDNPYELFHPGMVPSCDPGSPCPPRTDFYKEPGYKATDREDGDITSRVKVTEGSAAQTGTIEPCNSHDMIYAVTDSGGKTTTAHRTIHECNGA
jgi:hypothetical protein